MTRAAPTPTIVAAMARVGAYAAGTWRFDPTSRVTLTSGGSPKHRSGKKVTLPRLFGHRDTSSTACPGALYDRLGEIRKGAAALLGPAPRIVRVEITGAPVRVPTPLVVTGRLSRSVPWTAALRDAEGTIVARSSGTGTTARLEWNGLRPLPGNDAREGAPGGPLLALPGRYTWAVRVSNGWSPAHRVQDVVEVGLPLVPH